MNASTPRKSTGAFSLLWTYGGISLLVMTGMTRRCSGEWLLVLFLLWLGGAILFTLDALRSRSSVGILTLIGTLGFPLYVCYLAMSQHSHRGPAPITAAQTQLANFKTALDAYRVDTGFYPPGTNGLEQLLQRPAGATNWQGPYLENIPKDPWHNQYRYDCPGRHNTNSYDISSSGPPGANLVLGNWTVSAAK